MSKLNYAEVEKRFNNMTLRERLIMFAAVVLCSIFICYFWIIEPALVHQDKIKIQVQKTIQQENLINKEIRTVNKRLQEDPLKEIVKKIAFTEATLEKLNVQLDEKLLKFIHAQKMPIALTKVLSRTPGVKITGLTSLPVKVFHTSQGGSEDMPDILFYQHSLQITLQGNYNAIYQYFVNVEKLQDKFYWHSMDYKVSDYPLSEVIIEIYTLSDQQDLVSG